MRLRKKDDKKKQRDPFVPESWEGKAEVSWAGENDEVIKICVMGDDGVGKSALFRSLSDRKFDKSYRSAVGADVMQIKGDGKTYMIWILAGNLVRNAHVPYAYLGDRQSQNIGIIMFDVTQRSTFNRVETWVNIARREAGTSSIHLYLVGTKIDLPHRQVTPEEGMVLGERLGVPYLEVSAKTREGIETLLERTDLGGLTALIKELGRKFENWES